MGVESDSVSQRVKINSRSGMEWGLNPRRYDVRISYRIGEALGSVPRPGCRFMTNSNTCMGLE